MSCDTFQSKHVIVKDDNNKNAYNLNKIDKVPNKLYRSASSVIVTAKFPDTEIKVSMSLTSKYSKIHDLFSIIKKKSLSETPLNYYNEYRRKLMDVYLNESIDSKKENLEKIKKVLLEISNDNEEQSKIKDVTCNISKSFDSILKKMLEKYHKEMIKKIKFKVLNENENNLLKNYLERSTSSSIRSSSSPKIKSSFSKQIPPEPYIHSIKPTHFNLIDLDENLQRKPLQSSDHKNGKESFKKVSENIGFELIDFPNFRKSTTNKIEHNEEKSNEIYLIKILLNEFKNAIKTDLPDSQCISYLKRANNNLIEAVDLFFQAKFNSPKLRVIYLFPDGKEYVAEFSFTSNPDDLFVPVYVNYPSVNDVEIYYRTKKLEINPLLHNFIGNLGIINNSKLYVVCK